MGFRVDDINDEFKQHINLTDTAWLAIRHDLDNLNIEKKKESFSGFLNRIFRNFYQKSEASIAARCREYKQELTGQLLDDGIPEDVRLLIHDRIDLLTDQYAEKLHDKALEPYLQEKSSGAKFRINNANLDTLALSDESEYYSSIGTYLKAVFEDFARREEAERELIYYNDINLLIQQAMAERLKLKVYLPINPKKAKAEKASKLKFRRGYLTPFRLCQDRASINNYVVGIFEELYDDAVTGERRIVSIKLSKIIKMVLMRSMKGQISTDETERITKDLREKGPEFMKGKLLKIKVKFTEDGLRDFFKKLYFRPNAYEKVEGEENVYIVKCTAKQAENYFFPFGRDVTILEPIIIQKMFGRWYESANEHYQALAKDREKDARMIDEPDVYDASAETESTDVSTVAAQRGFRISNSPNIDDDDVIAGSANNP